MVKEITEKYKDIFTFDKYPDWVKDDRDKIIHSLLIRFERDLTFNSLENEVNKILISKIYENKLIDRLIWLRDRNILENIPKDTELLVWKSKKKEEDVKQTN